MPFVSQEHTDQYIEGLVARSRAAQREYESNFKTQLQVDNVLRAECMALATHAEELCREAVAETGMGNLQGKMRKLQGSCIGAWVFNRGVQSVGYVDIPDEPNVMYKIKPMGVIGAVMPSTNPLATIIMNAASCLKARNSIIVAPHPASAHVSDVTIAFIQDALEEAGAPRDLVLGISAEESSIEATNALIKRCDANIGTGGPGMVRAIYSCGKPAFGVGQGNCQDIIDLDIPVEQYPDVAKQICANRTSDNGVPCTGDQTVWVPAKNEQAWVDAMLAAGAFQIPDEKKDEFRELLFPEGKPRINRKIVGRMPEKLGEMVGLDIPESAPVVFLKNQAWGDQDLLCREILAPVVRYTTYDKFEEAVDHAVTTLYVEGAGHSSSLWTNNEAHVDYASDKFPVGRFRINMPTGGTTPTGLKFSATIGCGSWGGNSISDYLQWYHLVNKTRVVRRFDNLRAMKGMDEFNDWSVWNPVAD